MKHCLNIKLMHRTTVTTIILSSQQLEFVNVAYCHCSLLGFQCLTLAGFHGWGNMYHLDIDGGSKKCGSLELSCIPISAKSLLPNLFPSCKVMTMNAAKRRQDKSIAGTSTVNQSNDSRASSFNQSSPLCHFQQTKRLQQRPT